MLGRSGDWNAPLGVRGVRLLPLNSEGGSTSRLGVRGVRLLPLNVEVPLRMSKGIGLLCADPLASSPLPETGLWAAVTIGGVSTRTVEAGEDLRVGAGESVGTLSRGVSMLLNDTPGLARGDRTSFLDGVGVRCFRGV